MKVTFGTVSVEAPRFSPSGLAPGTIVSVAKGWEPTNAKDLRVVTSNGVYDFLTGQFQASKMAESPTYMKIPSGTIITLEF